VNVFVTVEQFQNLVRSIYCFKNVNNLFSNHSCQHFHYLSFRNNTVLQMWCLYYRASLKQQYKQPTRCNNKGLVIIPIGSTCFGDK